MKSKALSGIVLAVGIVILALSISCDEMGLSEDGGPVVAEQALESTCVCRVDSDVDTSGDGKTWETAKKTEEECVNALTPEAGLGTQCEVWVKDGAEVAGLDAKPSKANSSLVDNHIRIFRGFIGSEQQEKDRNLDRQIGNGLEGIQEWRELEISKRPEIQGPVEIPLPNLLHSQCDCTGLDVTGAATLASTLDVSGTAGIKTSSSSYYGLSVAGSNSDGSSTSVLHLIEGTYPSFLRMFLDGDEIDSNSTLQLQYNTENDVQICRNGGQVGIGTAPGSNKTVHIKGNYMDSSMTQGTLLIQDGYNSGQLLFDGNQIDSIANSGYTQDDLYLNYRSEGNVNMVIGGGYVGIGTTASGPHKLLVSGSSEVTGHVGIGIAADTSGSDIELLVDGTIKAEQVIVDSVGGADFVLEESYSLPSLDDVESYIKSNGHLPGIPSASEMQSSGINVAETTTILLKKIEELTLYAIDQNQKIELLEKTINGLGEREDHLDNHK